MIWVADYSFPGHPAEAWSVFDTSGVWLGKVATPGGFEIFEIGADYLLGVYRDDLTVEQVRLYGLRRDSSFGS